MKNSFYKFLFTLLPVILIFSCTKESDTLTTTTTNPPPVQSTDTYIVSGLVKDTLNQPIGGASLKAYFDDLEIEAMSDMDGNYEFEIPKSKTGGYIVAAKERYARTVQTINSDFLTLRKDLFLVSNIFSNEINLGLATDSIRIIRGKTNTPIGTPLENASILYFGYSFNTTLKIEEISFTKTDKDGNFELIIGNRPVWSEFVQASYGTRCGTRAGFYNLTDEPEQWLGEITLEDGIDLESEVDIEITQLDCGSSDGLAKAYFTDRLGYGVWERALGQIRFNYCNLGDSAVFFVGSHSADKQEFNGRFYLSNEIPETNDFGICTPTGYFFELYKNGVLETGTMGEVDGTVGNITLSGTDKQYVFINPRPSRLSSGGEIKVESGRFQGMFSIDSNNQVIEEAPSPEMGLHIDYIVNNTDEVAGIINGKMTETLSGTTNEYFIRFRMPKQ